MTAAVNLNGPEFSRIHTPLVLQDFNGYNMITA